MIIKNVAKALVPEIGRTWLRGQEKRIRYFYRRQRIRVPIALGRPLRIIIGAALTYRDGWYSTNEQWLDITSEHDWTRVFRGRALLDHVVAEHVFEHLTEDGARNALALIHRHMRAGSVLRIAVPDGYHPDPVYRAKVGIRGEGPDAADHKQLLTADSLQALLEGAGFTVRHLEGYRSDGVLVQGPVDSAEGYILRSRSNPENMRSVSGWDFVDANTSLIMDGIKH